MPKPCCASSSPRSCATNSSRMFPSGSFSVPARTRPWSPGWPAQKVTISTATRWSSTTQRSRPMTSAQAVSRHLGTKHTELPVAHIDPFDLLDMLPLFDQPFGNPTAHLNYLLSIRARKHITVALCGAGGDELFAGYPRYRAEQLARAVGRVPASLLRTLGRGFSAIPDSHHNMRLRRLKEFFLGWDSDLVERFTNWTYYMDEATKASLRSEERR